MLADCLLLKYVFAISIADILVSYISRLLYSANAFDIIFSVWCCNVLFFPQRLLLNLFLRCFYSYLSYTVAYLMILKRTNLDFVPVAALKHEKGNSKAKIFISAISLKAYIQLNYCIENVRKSCFHV